MDDDIFRTDRPRLFSIAYRMLGSATEAEDVLQDAWLRYRGAEQAAAVRSPRALATTIVTRLSLDRLKSGRAKRETYIGPWLPEPVLTSDVEAPEAMTERAESVTLAFLVLLEKLSAEERAVFVLKDVFDYGHAEIAEMLGTTPANSRQLLHRAKAHLAANRPKLSGTVESRREVAERFARAFADGDGSALAAILTQDVGFWSDGGGRVSSARRPLLGRDEVVNFLVGLHRTGQKQGLTRDVSLTFEEINFEPGLVLRLGGRLESIFVLSVEEGAIAGIRVVRNPEKLARIDRRLPTRH